MRKIAVLLIFELVVMGGLGVTATIHNDSQDYLLSQTSSNSTEYWALLVGVNKHMKKPWNNENASYFSTMDLYHQLIQSELWQPDHIKVLTGENASWLKIIQGLKWLDERDDENDICLFYISTHGVQAFEVYPMDEEDGLDECFIVYDTSRIYFPKIGLTIHIPKRFFYLYDDDLNNLLNQLDAKGVCAIIDTCYSAGFNDNSNVMVKRSERIRDKSLSHRCSAEDFNKEIIEEMSGSGRIVIAASAEDRLSKSYGFIHYIMEGLQGFGDSNNDGIITATEAFDYAAPKYIKFCERELSFMATPQIFNDYPDELPLAYSQFPPHSTTIMGPTIGKTTIEYTFNISAIDKENNDIRYYIDWGDGNHEITSYYPSGGASQLSHSWKAPGTYNIWFDAIDEHGAAKWWQTGMPDHISITITDEYDVDQSQIKVYEECCGNQGIVTHERWYAQSFVPTKPILTQVDLQTAVSAVETDPCQLIVSIRKDLKGYDLTSASVMPQQIHNHIIPEAPRSTWTTFDFQDIEIIPGEVYYIVCRFEKEAFGMWSYAGYGYDHDVDYIEDPYSNGTVFFSKNWGIYWVEHPEIQDLCFVTYYQK